MRLRLLSVLALAIFPLGLSADEPGAESVLAREAKPWTRWWWLGSGVDRANLTAQLESFAAAGLGGVEICPIYGAKGYEDRDLEFLSDEWIAVLAHTSRECERLGLGMDLTTGTGWPFGGPWVTPEMASHSVAEVRHDATGGPVRVEQPRAHFHDSFEYYGANWTPGLLQAFEKQHGYDLRLHLPALMGEGEATAVSRVAHDYRETLDALHRSYLESWNAWAKSHGSLTRNQAHGSPGNLLDHYAVADIPETEIFRHVDEQQIPIRQHRLQALQRLRLACPPVRPGRSGPSRPVEDARVTGSTWQRHRGGGTGIKS